MTDAEFYASENARLQAEWETMRVERDRLRAALADTEENITVVIVAMEMGGYPKRARAVLSAIRRRAGLES